MPPDESLTTWPSYDSQTDEKRAVIIHRKAIVAARRPNILDTNSSLTVKPNSYLDCVNWIQWHWPPFSTAQPEYVEIADVSNPRTKRKFGFSSLDLFPSLPVQVQYVTSEAPSKFIQSHLSYLHPRVTLSNVQFHQVNAGCPLAEVVRICILHNEHLQELPHSISVSQKQILLFNS